jgi:hypothetical protein
MNFQKNFKWRSAPHHKIDLGRLKTTLHYQHTVRTAWTFAQPRNAT